MPRPLNSTNTDLTAGNLLRLPAESGCPVRVYDVWVTRAQIVKLSQFDVVRFAQKACLNIHILRLMRKQGARIDSVSLGEIERAPAAGFVPGKDEIVFTVDMIDEATLARVHELSIPVDVGSVDILERLGRASPGHRVRLRINPGFRYGHSQKTNAGGENSRHGIWYSDLVVALEMIQHYKLKLAGTHTYTSSGVDYGHLKQVRGVMARQVVELGQGLEAISAGGNLSASYHEGEEAIDTGHYFSLWNAAYGQTAKHLGHPVAPEIEPGRFLAAETGVLMAQMRNVKGMGSRYFVLVDTGFNDLMRPTMYGSYHHISALAGDNCSLEDAQQIETVVAKPLCESGDMFIQQEDGNVEARLLSAMVSGDYLVLHDTETYGASMSSNYSSRPLLSEVLFDKDVARLIRRRQTIDELLALELT